MATTIKRTKRKSKSKHSNMNPKTKLKDIAALFGRQLSANIQKKKNHLSPNIHNEIIKEHHFDTMVLKSNEVETPESKAISLTSEQNRVSSISSIFSCKKQLGKGASCRVLLVCYIIYSYSHIYFI